MALWWVNGNLLQEGLCHTQSLCHCGKPLLTHTSTGDTQTHFWLSVCGFSGSCCTQGLFEPSECLWWVRGLILIAILPLLLSFWGFSFALEHRVSFFGGIQHSPIDGFLVASCNFGVLAGVNEHMSLDSTIFLHHYLWSYSGFELCLGCCKCYY